MSSRNPVPSSWLCASTVGILGPGQMLTHWEEEVSYGLACLLRPHRLLPGTLSRFSDPRDQLCQGKVESGVKQ